MIQAILVDGYKLKSPGNITKLWKNKHMKHRKSMKLTIILNLFIILEETLGSKG